MMIALKRGRLSLPLENYTSQISELSILFNTSVNEIKNVLKNCSLLQKTAYEGLLKTRQLLPVGNIPSLFKFVTKSGELDFLFYVEEKPSLIGVGVIFLTLSNGSTAKIKEALVLFERYNKEKIEAEKRIQEATDNFLKLPHIFSGFFFLNSKELLKELKIMYEGADNVISLDKKKKQILLLRSDYMLECDKEVIRYDEVIFYFSLEEFKIDRILFRVGKTVWDSNWKIPLEVFPVSVPLGYNNCLGFVRQDAKSFVEIFASCLNEITPQRFEIIKKNINLIRKIRSDDNIKVPEITDENNSSLKDWEKLATYIESEKNQMQEGRLFGTSSEEIDIDKLFL